MNNGSAISAKLLLNSTWSISPYRNLFISNRIFDSFLYPIAAQDGQNAVSSSKYLFFFKPLNWSLKPSSIKIARSHFFPMLVTFSKGGSGNFMPFYKRRFSQQFAALKMLCSYDDVSNIFNLIVEAQRIRARMRVTWDSCQMKFIGIWSWNCMKECTMSPTILRYEKDDSLLILRWLAIWPLLSFSAATF